MARGYRKNERYESKYHEEDSSHFWMSYSDLMSALLLMFALLLMVTIFDSKSAAEEKDQMIENVIGVKMKIIKELEKEFSDSNLAMEVDPQTGAIRFSGGVFFETDSAKVSVEGKKNLQEFIPKYISILLSDQFRDEVSQIIVEGHTDDQGTYLYNLDLSQARATSVVKEIYGEGFTNFAHKEELKKVITSNGRSFSVPIIENGKINKEKSRRVEFQFRLKDEEVIKEIQKLVNKNE
jgi:outer membrane protein OmpA-like peptidoglycan-associated protein